MTSRRTLTSERARAMAAARHAKPPSTEPPEGWSSWTAYRRYMEDADGGRAPYRQLDPLTIRTYLEVASETP